MPYSSLRDFMARLEREGRLVRVREPVSTVLEMTEIQTRLLAEDGPAVLFEHALKADSTRSAMPVRAGSAPRHRQDARLPASARAARGLARGA